MTFWKSTLAAVLVTAMNIAVDASTGRTFVYVANEGSDNISAFAVDPATGGLSPVAGSPFPSGSTPAVVKIAPSKRFAYVTNYACPPPCPAYGPASVSAYSIDATTGTLTPVAGSPFAAERGAFGIDITPSGRFMYVANYDSDDISAYSVDETTGALAELPGSPFPGVDHPLWVVIEPSGKFLYVMNAKGVADSISVFSIDPLTGGLSEVGGSPFPSHAYPFGAAVSPSGQFLYVPNGVARNLSVYAIDMTSGAIAEIPGSPFAAAGSPQSLALSPSGQFLYVAGCTSASVSGFSIDGSSGSPSPVPGSPFVTGGCPFGTTADPEGRFVYFADNYLHRLSVFSIDSATGTLTPVPGSPFATGLYPASSAAVTFEEASYQVCLLYDPTKAVKSGATMPIKLQLCDGSGANLSSASIVLHATGVTQTSTNIDGPVQDAGNANPDYDFRYDASLGDTGGYIFNLKTTGLATGSYVLKFQAGTDPAIYSAPFQVK